MDTPTKPTGPYATAEEWIDADAAWQQRLYDTGGKKPRLDNPPESMFHGNAEEHAKAVKGRKRVCFREGHPQDRTRLLEPHEYNASDNTCKICKGAATKKSKDATRKPVVTYATAEAWFAEHASDTSSKHLEMTVGNCKVPKESQFESTLEYERAKVLHAQRYQEYQEQIRKYRNKSAENDRKREQYVEDKETEEGREKLRKKMKKDQENKMKRKDNGCADTTKKWCTIGSHIVDRSETIFCPVADLGIADFHGPRGRTEHAVCKYHYLHARDKWTRFRIKYRSDISLRIGFRIEWWRKEAKKKNGAILLTRDQQREIVMKPCFYCNANATDEAPNGVDMMDAVNVEYRTDTCVPCCDACNMSKNAMLPDMYIQKCKDIAMFQTSGVRATVHIPFRQIYVKNGVRTAVFYYGTGTYAKFKYEANKRNKVFEITEEQFMDKKRNGCYLCGISKLLHIGIDRIDNSIGYTFDNTAGCCTTCNMMKWRHDKTEFIATCIRVANVAQAPSVSTPNTSTQ